MIRRHIFKRELSLLPGYAFAYQNDKPEAEVALKYDIPRNTFEPIFAVELCILDWTKYLSLLFLFFGNII